MSIETSAIPAPKQFDQKVLEAYEQAQVQEAQKSPDPEGQEENGPTMAM